MEYKCQKCEWSGHWDEMIHETLCPLCRNSTKPSVERNESGQKTARSTSPE